MGRGDIEGALLVLFFFAIAVATPLASFLISKQNSSVFFSISWLALCAGTSLFAQMGIKSVFVEATLFWDYITLVFTYLLPAALYSLIDQSLSQGSHKWLARMSRLHIVYVVAALVGVAANIVTAATAVNVFGSITAITGLFVFGVVVKKAIQGNLSARIIAVGLSLLAVSIDASLLAKEVGIAWPVHYTPHWGLGIIILTFLLMLRLQLLAEILSNRKILARTWRSVSSTGCPVELRGHKSSNGQAEQALPSEQLKQAVTGSNYQSEQAIVTEDKITCFAHEINSPLGTGIMTASYLSQEVEDLALLFKEGAIKKSDLERHLNLYSESADIILANLQSAAEIVKDFRKSAAGQQAQQRQTFSIKAQVKQVLLALKPRLTQAGHQIQLNCGADLRISGFPNLLSQVIANLVLNSLFHGYDQGEQGSIVLNIFKEDNMVVFEYSDDGKGMNEDTLAHIFEPHFTTNREHGSTGLGLSIVKEIITAKCGGTIVCHSTEGKGVIFTIRLPIGELS
ncbi:sensor histidine kinase [Sporomusa malonica]|uniref:histidine kinase n=1 Tax=Sporomusa malonica TaxID=112901 RepID=A0A1W1ZPQ9_9FIRM|nr:HAMP domain-containing sensor histidine kinase [Sporomusa malonica]SMC50088.1 Signal transduction histidine kinase [Sporomusa malonica]